MTARDFAAFAGVFYPEGGFTSRVQSRGSALWVGKKAAKHLP
jgi:hypothetical protein